MATATIQSERPVQFEGQTRAPRTACVFSCPSQAVQFAEEDAKSAGRFTIQAYDGGISKHWYWGNFGIDLDGVTFASDPLPVLDSHFTDRRIGVSTGQKIGKKVTVDGRFLSNDLAQALRQDAGEGFPLQASLAANPAVIEYVEDGATAKVNGKTLKGPGTVWRQAAIYEVSIVALGALANTKTTVFSGGEEIEFTLLGKDEEMAKEEKAPALTLDTLRSEFGEIYQQAAAAGAEQERGRFATLRAACGPDAGMLATAFAEGWTTEKVHQERANKLTAENTKLREQLAQKPAAPKAEIRDAATQEFVTQPSPEDGKAAFDETTASDEQLKVHFEQTPDLRKEFAGQVDDYVSFVYADRDGRVKIKH